MEPKVNYILVGAFVVLLGATILGAIFWLGKTDYRGIYDRYYVYTRESVAGLSVDSTVKYRGVDVGRVKQVILNPENAEEVRVTLDIVVGTPVKTDTQAVLVTQGLIRSEIIKISSWVAWINIFTSSQIASSKRLCLTLPSGTCGRKRTRPGISS